MRAIADITRVDGISCDGVRLSDRLASPMLERCERLLGVPLLEKRLP